MRRFRELEEDLRPLFEQMQRIKEKYQITSLTLESFRLLEQFHGYREREGNFLGTRRFGHTRNPKEKFIETK